MILQSRKFLGKTKGYSSWKDLFELRKQPINEQLMGEALEWNEANSLANNLNSEFRVME